MMIQDYNMPAKLTFRKETTNKGETFFSVRVEAVDNDGSKYMLDVTKCEAAQRLLQVFKEELKKRGF